MTPRTRAIPRPAAAAALGLLAAAAFGCTSYETALAEFDSVARWHEAEGEPAAVAYTENPTRWPWAVRTIEGSGLDVLLVELLGLEPSPHTVENPGEFARERMLLLAERAAGDLQRTAEVAVRCLWVSELDDHPLNQGIAYRAMQRLIRALQLEDLLRGPHRVADPAQVQEQLRGWSRTLTAYWPDARKEPLAGEARREWTGTLRAATAAPLPRSRDQRTLILLLARALALETDRELAAAAKTALREALRHAFAQSLVRGMTRAESPLVRETAIRTLRAVAGPAAVPFVLATIYRRAVAVETVNRYDNDPAVRLTLVRMCSQLHGHAALQNAFGGPAPIEFLYDTAMNPKEDEGLRTVALEGLALSLERPVSFDPKWAQEWWDEWALGRRGEG